MGQNAKQESCRCGVCRADRSTTARAARGSPRPSSCRHGARELEASGDREARFFHFIADGGVWIAYGLADGDVRGVYCPSHNSQRAERSRAAICCMGDDVLELPLAA